MFSTVKRFDSNKVIQFALSTLSVTSEKLNATMITEDVIALDSVLWKLHSSVIKTISALIKWYKLQLLYGLKLITTNLACKKIAIIIYSCGRILIPQGISICRILLQSLNMTQLSSSNYIYGTTRPNL
jgi:hypothetical protein